MTTHSSDLRAPSRAAQRDRARRVKYFNFRHIHAGQLDQPHHKLGPFAYIDLSTHATSPNLPAAAPIEMWSKRRLYTEAQQWPRPPRLHRASPDKWRDKWGKTSVWFNRKVRKKEMRKSIEGVEKEDEWRLKVLEERRMGERCGAVECCGSCEMEREFYWRNEYGWWEGEVEDDEEVVRVREGRMHLGFAIDQAVERYQDADWEVIETQNENDEDEDDFVVVVADHW